MGSARRVVLGVALGSAVAGCGGRESSPRIDALNPPTISNLASKTVHIQGRSFFNASTTSLDSTTPPSVDAQWHVQLVSGATDLALPDADVVWVSPTDVDATFPAAFATTGSWTLALTSPAGKKATATLNVQSSSAGLGLGIVDASSGVVIGTKGVIDGDVVTVVAMALSTAGTPIAPVRVDWTPGGGDTNIGPITLVGQTAATLSVLRPGSIDVTAVDAQNPGANAGATFNASLGPPAMLRVESKADGTGVVLTTSGTFARTDDDTVTAYAILRDVTQQFLSNDASATWSVVGGIGVASGGPSGTTLLDFQHPGVGALRADDLARGLSGSAGSFTVSPGKAAALAVTNPSATVTYSADTPSQAFTVAGTDADGNPTTDLGVVTWSVASGPISAMAANGMFNPAKAGSGTVKATSSYGPFAVSPTINVDPGMAATLALAPMALSTNADAAPVTFTVAGTDADGNVTTDLGAITWSVTSGGTPPTALGAVTNTSALFTPTLVGDGNLVAQSDLGGGVNAAAPITITPGALASITVSPPSATVAVGSSTLQFAAAGADDKGNAAPTGAVSWSTTVVSAIDGAGLLTPHTAGNGTVVASAGGKTGTASPVNVLPGPATTFTITPGSPADQVSGNPPLAFSAQGYDVFANTTSNVGTVVWSLGTGATMTAIDPSTGMFTPTLAGVGHVHVENGSGAFGDTSLFRVTPGPAASIAITPGSVEVVVDSASTVAFSVTGVDAAGNSTPDVGTISWSGSGGFATFDTGSGVLTPTAAGSGHVTALSSYGPQASAAVTVDAAGGGKPLLVTAVLAPASVVPGQAAEPVTVRVRSNVGPVPLVGAWLTFTAGSGNDAGADYAVAPDRDNPDTASGAGDDTLHFFVRTSSTATNGTIAVTAHAEAFDAGSGTFVGDVRSTSWHMAPGSSPVPAVSQPVIAPQNEACLNDVLGVSGTVSGGLPGYSYDWRFAGAFTGSANTISTSQSYPSLGVFPYRFQVTDATLLTDVDIAEPPIFVGQVRNDASEFPSSPIRFAQPTPNQPIDMAMLPSSAFVKGDDANPLTQCSGMPLDAFSAHREATVFVDRGVIDTQVMPDADPSLPGIQVSLDAAGALPAIPLKNAVPRLPGAAKIWAEFTLSTGGGQTVTSAGAVPFQLVDDTEAPTVVGSVPSLDSDAHGWSHTDPFVFHFSEPMNPTALAPLVEFRASGNVCNLAGFADVTSASTISYDALSRTMTVVPPSGLPPNSYLRVTLASSQDASGNAIASPFTRCVGLGVVGTAGLAAFNVPPVWPTVFSPDGDGNADTCDFHANVYPSTTPGRVTVEIFRDGAPLVTLAQELGITGIDVVWDGRDNDGRVVPNGFYGVRMKAFARDGHSDQEVDGVVEVRSAISYIDTAGPTYQGSPVSTTTATSSAIATASPTGSMN